MNWVWSDWQPTLANRRMAAEEPDMTYHLLV